MANRNIPGGGFLGGSGAQEEELCRRTSLYRHLVFNDFPRREFEVQYHSLILVVKGPRTRDFGPLVDPFWTSVISGSVYHHPRRTTEGRLMEPYSSRTRLMIRHLLASAIEMGHETLVLSAWGCGAFGNPPEDIANFFKEELSRPGVFRSLKKVVFAILDDDRMNNFEIFSSVFRVRSHDQFHMREIPQSQQLPYCRFLLT